MKIIVDVEAYQGNFRDTHMVEITDEDIKALAEQKLMDTTYCESCKGKTIKIEFQE